MERLRGLLLRERSGVRLWSGILTDGSTVYEIHIRQQETGCRWCDRPATTLNRLSGSSACERHEHDSTPPREHWILFLEPESEDAALLTFNLLADAVHAASGMLEIAKGVDHLAEQGMRS